MDYNSAAAPRLGARNSKLKARPGRSSSSLPPSQ
eukprot:CAMPEP_0194748216 /NCGR_PEP_ID=MMETSP0323_2-20130528/2385_1 /TAXON_ID=2866 ORGANISM="Crypthecodinium cohnii, Strain Seligo" /NCGR_SAMPLE_ID=MMETSP0323_2 /ASSEMBLY_ACC=CAM_ASM_000346 /LENGTH=33 /DNA_ID= /DNA_START= /DNA_END= /DNA_ORIENTATION=